jgi:putative aldouronate transport system substrate-binding protein
MNRKLTKSMVVMMAALLVLTACSDKPKDAPAATSDGKPAAAPNVKETGFPLVNTQVTLKMMGPKAALHGPWEQMDLFTEMEKKTNMKFIFDTPSVESYQAKKNLAFASGEVPDVFFGGPLTPNDEVVYGQQGILIPLEGLIDKYAPTIAKILKDNPDIRSSITLPDGHIYSLPRINNVTRDLAGGKLWINQTWLDKLGLQLPKSTDDLYTVLKAFKEKDPNGNGKADEIPFTSMKLNDIRPALLAAFGQLTTGGSFVSVVDGKLNMYPIHPGYKEMVTYLNKLHKEGLLDNESFAQSSQQLTAKGNSGNLGVFDSGGGAFTVVGTDKNDQYTLIPPLLSPSNSTLIFPKKSNLVRGLFSITNKNQVPEATMRWIDYLYTDEGSVLAVFGKENEGWKWLDVGKTTWERVTPQGMQPEEYRGGKVTPDAGVAIATIRLQDFLAKRANSGQIGQVDVEVDNKIIKHWKESFPLVYFKEAEQTRVNILEADMKPYIEQMEAKFITGTESLDNWGKYVDTLKKMGADEYLKLHQDAYDTWKKGNK